jgi:hypothetical protein
MAKKLVAPAGMVLCDGDNDSCGKVHYDGKKGGPRPTDELVCSGQTECDNSDCECQLCYTIKFKNHDKTYIFLPWTASISAKPTRAQVKDIEKDERKAAKQLDLEIETFDWQCFCLKAKPITGKK